MLSIKGETHVYSLFSWNELIGSSWTTCFMESLLLISNGSKSLWMWSAGISSGGCIWGPSRFEAQMPIRLNMNMHFLWERVGSLAAAPWSLLGHRVELPIYMHTLTTLFAWVVTAFHVQPRQDCCGPWWEGSRGRGLGWGRLSWVGLSCSDFVKAGKKNWALDRPIKWWLTFSEYKCVQGHAGGSLPRSALNQPCPLHGWLVTISYRLMQRLSSRDTKWMNTDCGRNEAWAAGSSW